MATTSVKCIFVVVFLATLGCNCGSSSSVRLQISDMLTSVEYGNFSVRIYEHANNHRATTAASEKMYFYSPLVLLDHKSAVSVYDRVTNQHEMRFRIEMWNNKVQSEVVKHLNKIIGHHEIKSHQVKVLPLEKIILVFGLHPIDFSLNPNWTYYFGSKTLSFSLWCYDQKVCDKLANLMRSDPIDFDDFKLLYSLSSHQTWQTKQATISNDRVTSGRLVSTLLEKFEKVTQEILLTANDEKKMLKETATNIRKHTLEENEVWSPNTEFQILKILKNLLVTSTTTIKEQSDKMWHSVFWDDNNYRPEKTTKNLNEIVKKLDKETRKKLTDMFEKAKKKHQSVNSNSWVDVDGISSVISEKLANDSDDSSRRAEFLKKNVRKLLQESREHVQWDGEKFVPKPIQLSRINLGKFILFQDRKVRVRYTTADLSAPINFVERAGVNITEELTE